MTKIRLALLLSALAVALLAPSAHAAQAASTTSTKLFGFNDNAGLFGLVSDTTDTQLAQQDGANVHRVMFDWRWAEPQPGVWDLAKYDAIYNADVAKGIKPLFILMFAPQWTWADGTPCTQATQDCRYPPSPSHMDAWRDAAQKLVQRYPKMAALEVWNEPNYSGFWQGGLDPAAYAQLVIQAHDAVKAVGSSIPVLGGSITAYNAADSSDALTPRTFIKGMYDAGVKGHMDGISVHPYPQDIDLYVFFKTLTDIRDVRQDNGDNATPLWITEAGVTTTPNSGTFYLSENDQAVYMKKLYNELNGMSDVKSIIFHTLLDPSNVAASDPEHGYGMMHADLTPKPAYCALAALRGTSYRCPRSVPAVQSNATQDLRWTAQDYVQAALDAARTWRASHASYAGLTTAGLHSLNSTLSATAPGDQVPGTSADPSRVGVWIWNDATYGETLLLCNASKADRSYCIQARWGTSPIYGMADGSVNAAAGAVTNGASWWW